MCDYYSVTIMDVERLRMWERWLEFQHLRIRAIVNAGKENVYRHSRRRRQQRRREVWVRQWLTRRTIFGQYEELLQELNREDHKGYKNFLRVDADLFGELLERIGPIIEKKDTHFR